MRKKSRLYIDMYKDEEKRRKARDGVAENMIVPGNTYRNILPG
jgi:hypothetical protein